MIRHHVAFDNFYTFILTQRYDDFFYAFTVLIIDRFSSILWSEHDMIFAHLFGMGQTICLIRH